MKKLLLIMLVAQSIHASDQQVPGDWSGSPDGNIGYAALREQIDYSWQDMHILCNKIVQLLQQKKEKGKIKTPLKTIVALTHEGSGFEPVPIIVQALREIPGMLVPDQIVDIGCLCLYGDKKDCDVRSIELNNDLEELIVCALADNGLLIREAKVCYGNAIFAALLARPTGMKFMDLVAREITQDAEVVFPWQQESKYYPTKLEQLLK